jgi:hypothetical protein
MAHHRLQLLNIIAMVTFLAIYPWAGAQQGDMDAGKSIAQVEAELAPLAALVLNDSSTERKIAVNKQLIQRLTRLLQRPESYDHPFTALKTISRLSPADETFRIFTWYIIDNPTQAYYSDDSHYYFGLVQRRFVDARGETHYLVIPLMELEQLPMGVENMVFDNFSWFGALYYKPKDSEHLPHYDGFYYKLTPGRVKQRPGPGKQEEVLQFTPGKYRGRHLSMADQPQYSNYRREKTKTRYYLLMGWNGWDRTASYKVVDVLTFDEKDSMKVHFGAPIFYFDQIPKARALFKYSDYAVFNLNFEHVRRGPFKLFSKRMLVYDHLAQPQQARPLEQYPLGPDGSCDALSYYPRHGYFEWYRDVQTSDAYNSRRHAREMAQLQAQYVQGDSTLPHYDQLQTRPQIHRGTRYGDKIAKKQRKELEKQLEESGIQLPKPKRNED